MDPGINATHLQCDPPVNWATDTDQAPGRWKKGYTKRLVLIASFSYGIPVGVNAVTCGEQLDKVHKEMSKFL